jgi:serine/threonine protein kinase
MSERDKRQIVAEVNILKDLHHEHIVRYHDRMVDRDAGTLYILMEFCGGGDLSSLIKRSAREAERAGMPPRGLDEEKVWNILMQLLRALVYCHHPNAAAGNASSSGSQPPAHQRSPSMGGGGDGEVKRAQILHRDLKPDNGTSSRPALPPLISQYMQCSSMRTTTSNSAILGFPRHCSSKPRSRVHTSARRTTCPPSSCKKRYA